jgi:Xaa-Pro dipeptidase
MLVNRLQRLAEGQRTSDVGCVALVPGPNLRYLAGLTLFTSERPIVAFFPASGRPAVLLPALEKGRAEAMAGQGVDFFAYTDEQGYESAFAGVAEALELDGQQIAVEYRHMRVLELRALEGAAPRACFVSLEATIPGLRVIKDADEIGAMREAIAITEEALRVLISQPLIGLNERQIADRLAQEMLKAGADAVDFIIVVAGPNGADPHAGPSDRPVQAGEFLTIDCGVTRRGYPSDLTRTFSMRTVNKELRDIYEAVLQSNAAGRAATRPGVAAQEVDRAARRVIDDAGYGEYFIHRTGHGLGLEGHEPPYIVEGNQELLEPGMVFTVEPGIYIPGLGGVRIEDNVVVTKEGMECLTSFPRELMILS